MSLPKIHNCDVCGKSCNCNAPRVCEGCDFCSAEAIAEDQARRAYEEDQALEALHSEFDAELEDEYWRTWEQSS